MLKSIILAAIAALNGGSFTADYFPCPHNSGMVIVRDTTGLSVYELHIPMTQDEVGSVNVPIGDGDFITLRWSDEFVKVGVASDPTMRQVVWSSPTK